jgi:hypothetical protein
MIFKKIACKLGQHKPNSFLEEFGEEAVSVYAKKIMLEGGNLVEGLDYVSRIYCKHCKKILIDMNRRNHE